MPTLTGNPSQYSKDQLKNVLISHNVRLPQGDQRKAVYLQLYLKHILPKDQEAADFSSDDEDTSESDLQPVGDHEEQKSDKMDLKSLSDSELKEQLRKHGVNPGPILPTTRTIYEKKLQQLVEEQAKENGGGHEDQYSDSEDEDVQVKSVMNKRSELYEDGGDRALDFDSVLTDSNNPSSRRSSLTSRPITHFPKGPYKHIPASLAAEFNKNLATLGDDFSVTKMLKQMERKSFSSQATGYEDAQESKNLTPKSQYDDNSPGDFSDLMPQSSLGLSATRRKPIKGAAGRPIQFRYDDITTRARMQEQPKETVTEGKSRLVSVRLQILIFIVVVFVALVYLSMESSSENPFNSATEDLVEVQQPTEGLVEVHQP